jgi:hypothetical protein
MIDDWRLWKISANGLVEWFVNSFGSLRRWTTSKENVIKMGEKGLFIERYKKIINYWLQIYLRNSMYVYVCVF